MTHHALPLFAALVFTTLVVAAPPTKPNLDLDAFEKSMQTARLANGMSIGYVDRGPRDGVPVVLIHGFTNNARSWTPLIPYLDPRFRLIVVDVRGHGISSKPECCYTRLDMAYDIKLLLDQLHINSAHIIGHSLGSIVSQMFAETWPERTRHVVLIGSTGGVRADCNGGDATLKPPLPGMRAELLKLKDPIDPDSPFMSAWYGNAMAPDPDVVRRQRRDAAAIPVRVWLAILDQGVTGMDLQATLPRLMAPTLLIWGDKDTLMPEPVRCALREALPKARVHVFPTYGHNPAWDDPVAVAALINPFINETTTP